jgi:hypothetical protein
MRAVAVGQIEGLGTAPRLKVKDGAGERIADEQWDKSEVSGHAQALQRIAGLLRSRFQGSVLAGVGHRVVHGGPDYAAPLLVTPEAMRRLEDFIPLAPLHQPHNLAAIRAVQEVQPELPQVACFDTAFHQTQERVAQFYGLPYEYFEQGVRRYGFHGLSYEYIAAASARYRASRSRRAGGRRPPRQRRQHVRDARGPQRRQLDGLHRARRPADGDAAGQHGSRHRPLPAAAGGNEREADRGSALQALGPARPVRHRQRHARSAGERGTARPAGDRPLRVPHQP